MMKRALLLLLLAIPMASAVGQVLPGGLPTPLPGRIGDVIGRTVDQVEAVPARVTRLAADRLARIDALVSAHPEVIARDESGNPARAGEVIVADPDDALVAAAAAAGFTLIERETIAGVDIGYARFRAPPGKSLPRAIKALRKIAGRRDVSADQLHFQSGARPIAPARPTFSPSEPPGAGVPNNPGPAPRLGMIDGGVSAQAGIAGDVVRAGFARGAGGGSNHGTAVASLVLGTPRIRGVAPAGRLWAADVYGSDPAGGSALAIARALGWLSSEHIPVTVISLVGPANPLLARVVQAAQAKGMIIVAAVGNDGPAAPPSYPASYPGVVAVTGVDGADRALIEAGRALHLDYAAPGADMLAADAGGNAVAVRGTSFAAPLVAALIARRYDQPVPAGVPAALRQIDATARDLGKRGPDPRYGRGLVCGDCRTPAR